jgi:hypothetical protein
MKSGLQRLASKYGFVVANPDTRPRQTEIKRETSERQAPFNYRSKTNMNVFRC